MNRVLVYGMTNNPGGIETYLRNLFRLVNPTKVILDFVVDFPEMCYAGEFQNEGARIFYISAKSQGIWKQWKELYKILKQNPEYRYIYFNILDAGAAITMVVPWLLGKKIIVHSHNNNTEKIKLHRICRPFLNFFSSMRFACSKSAAFYMYGNQYGKKAQIIPNAIDCKRYQWNPSTRLLKREELGIGGEYVICHVGRLSKQKNVKKLLDIFSYIHEKERSAVLLSIGDGESRDEILEYAKSLNLMDKILFLGRRYDVPELLQAADVFVFPSLYEGFGIVAIEAQAAGLPCVLSDRVPREVQVTQDVIFLGLDEPLERWANKIMKYKYHIRKNTRDRLIEAGYDIEYPGQAQIRLMELFEK